MYLISPRNAIYDENIYRKQLKENAWNLLEIPSVLNYIFQINDAQIDVIDISICHPFVADFIAVEGQLLYEKVAGEFYNYRKIITLNHQKNKRMSQQLRKNIDTFLKIWNPT